MLTFEEAVVLWRRHRNDVEGDGWLWLACAEKTILAHSPRTPAEAAVIVDVLIEQGDARPDRLHMRALEHLSAFLKTAALPAPGPC